MSRLLALMNCVKLYCNLSNSLIHWFLFIGTTLIADKKTCDIHSYNELQYRYRLGKKVTIGASFFFFFFQYWSHNYRYGSTNISCLKLYNLSTENMNTQRRHHQASIKLQIIQKRGQMFGLRVLRSELLSVKLNF